MVITHSRNSVRNEQIFIELSDICRIFCYQAPVFQQNWSVSFDVFSEEVPSNEFPLWGISVELSEKEVDFFIFFF